MKADVGASSAVPFAEPLGGPPKASELLAQQLRNHILGHGLPPGTRLPSERELTESRHLSRASVREALRLLEAEGLVTIKRGPRGGVTVRHPDPSSMSRSLVTMVALEQVPLRQLFAFRMAVEPAAAATAADAITPEGGDRLLAAAEGLDGDVPERVDFHVLVAELSGNALHRMILAALHDVLELHVRLEALTPEDVRQTQIAHQKLAQTIAAGDATRAAKAMQRHLASFQQRMEELGRLDAPIIPRAALRRGQTVV
jgi:GntR family transcriptional regulator, transcriptional repressor for pyruvate dehydrogenase complex